jgi:hypothetical protein
MQVQHNPDCDREEISTTLDTSAEWKHTADETSRIRHDGWDLLYTHPTAVYERTHHKQI